jgi:hypothetical protein
MTAPLITSIEQAGEGSRELDWQLVKALFGFSMWKSKHGYWNLDWPAEWPFSERPLHCSIPGRSPDDVYDSETGKKLPPVAVPTDWLDTIECPEFTTSLDAALALAERVLKPPYTGPISLTIAGSGQAYIDHIDPCGMGVQAFGRTPALALCLAILKATNQEQPNV